MQPIGSAMGPPRFTSGINVDGYFQVGGMLESAAHWRVADAKCSLYASVRLEIARYVSHELAGYVNSNANGLC